MWTSYFAKHKQRENGISICAKKPQWWAGPEYKALAPSYDILMEYKNSKLSKVEKEEIYVERYNKEILSKLDPEKVYEDLKDKVMLCYEVSDDFCHRHLAAKWIEENMNVKVEEI